MIWGKEATPAPQAADWTPNIGLGQSWRCLLSHELQVQSEA